MTEAAYDALIGITLPDAVKKPHVEVNRLILPDLLCDIMQNTIPEVDGIVESNKGNVYPKLSRVEFEDSFTSKTGTGIFTVRFGPSFLSGSAVI